MICIIATSEHRARAWADNQGLEKSEWFCPQHEDQLLSYQNFHTIVIDIFPEHRLGWFERVYHKAKQRGVIGRK